MKDETRKRANSIHRCFSASSIFPTVQLPVDASLRRIMGRGLGSISWWPWVYAKLFAV